MLKRHTLIFSGFIALSFILAQFASISYGKASNAKKNTEKPNSRRPAPVNNRVPPPAPPAPAPTPTAGCKGLYKDGSYNGAWGRNPQFPPITPEGKRMSDTTYRFKATCQSIFSSMNSVSVNCTDAIKKDPKYLNFKTSWDNAFATATATCKSTCSSVKSTDYYQSSVKAVNLIPCTPGEMIDCQATLFFEISCR